MVVMSWPSQLAASSVHESMETPSTSTVHAPQQESSHPRLEPVRSRSLRNTSSSNELGSIATSCMRPLILSSTRSFFIPSLYLSPPTSHLRLHLPPPPPPP